MAQFSSVTSTLSPLLFLNYRAPLFLIFVLFVLGKNILNQNDAEFDFRKGDTLELLKFFGIIKVDHFGGGYEHICYATSNSRN